MTNDTGKRKARQVLNEIGIDSALEIPIELIVSGRGAILRFESLKNCDGRIAMGEKRSLITIDNGIHNEGRKRFTIAHELGHHELHRNIFESHNDSGSTLNWFDNRVFTQRKGIQEYEANQFATEFLMPEATFLSELNGRNFSPPLIRELSEKFISSKTSIIFRYIELGKHPICIFFMHNNRVIYWKKSIDFNHSIRDLTRLEPPDDSVAFEFYKSGKIYDHKDSRQEIVKSTWCNLNWRESDNDYNFYEWCLVMPDLKTALSVVWEEA